MGPAGALLSRKGTVTKPRSTEASGLSLEVFQKELRVRPGSGTGPVALLARTQAFRPGSRW